MGTQTSLTITGTYDIKTHTTEVTGGVINAVPGQGTLTTDPGGLIITDLNDTSNYSTNTLGGNVQLGTSNTGSPIIGGKTLNDSGITRGGVTATVNGVDQTSSAVSTPPLKLDAFLNKPVEGAMLTEAGTIFTKDAYKTAGDLTQALTQRYEESVYISKEAQKILDDPNSTPAQRADATRIQEQANNYIRRDQAQYDAFKEGGLGKVVIHSVVGGLAAAVGGDNVLAGITSGGLAEAARPLTNDQSTFVQNLSSTLVGYVVGGAPGANIALTAELNNRQLHPSEIDAINKYAGEFADKINNSPECKANKNKCITEEEAKKILGWGVLDKVDEVWHNELEDFEAGRYGSLYKDYGATGYNWLLGKAKRNEWALPGSGQAFFTATSSQYKDQTVFIDSVGYDSANNASPNTSPLKRDLAVPLMVGTTDQGFYDKHLRLDQDGNPSVTLAGKDLLTGTWDSAKSLFDFITNPEKLATLPEMSQKAILKAYDDVKNCAGDVGVCLKVGYLGYIQETQQDRLGTSIEVAASVVPVEKVIGVVKGIGTGAKVGGAIEDAAKAPDPAKGPGAKDDILPPCSLNSFDPMTLVLTNTGLFPISKLTVGTSVLAYNELTSQNGYYPITAVHRNLDPELTSLWVKSNSGAIELIQTTPEHPFYLDGNIDASPRPKPVGHTELNSKWVGAGHLKIGDKIRQSDGSSGVISNVTTYQQTREMFNLTVETAHTFYVGMQGWLVHNIDCYPVTEALQHEVDELLSNLGPYSETGGHHIIGAANAVPSNKRSGNVIVDAMLTIPDDVLARYGVQHRGQGSLTSITEKRSREFAKSGAVNTWENQRDIAYNSLVDAGMDYNLAAALANIAYEDAKKLMPSGPPRTPFGK